MHRSPPVIVRSLVIFFVLLLAAAVYYPLSQKLIGQLHFRKAQQYTETSRYQAALEKYQQAAAYLPNDSLVSNSLGNVYYRLANLVPQASETVLLLKRAAYFFDRALQLNPLDARSAYGLARVKIRLTQHEVLAGTKTRATVGTEALGTIEKAIELRPASGIYRLTLVRYLYLINEHMRLLAEIKMLGRMQPSFLGQLQREPFWSAAARSAFAQGVQEALAAETTPRQSLFALAEIMAAEKKWQQALSYRIEGMAVQSSLNRSADYLSLGYLYSMKSETDKAQAVFFQGLERSDDIERDITRVLQIYRSAADPQPMNEFYLETAERYGNSIKVDMRASRYLMELDDYENAKIVLLNGIARQPHGELYFLLAKIAEKKQDWDEVELSIQKAAMLDPQNTSYHLMFSQVLNRLQKYERAEKEAGLAIKYSEETPAAGLFHYRASLRTKTKDYQGALSDWQQALSLEPENASFHYHAGDAAENLARIDEAAEYFQQAIHLEPGNKTYSRRLDRIEKKYGVKNK